MVCIKHIPAHPNRVKNLWTWTVLIETSLNWLSIKRLETPRTCCRFGPSRRTFRFTMLQNCLGAGGESGQTSILKHGAIWVLGVSDDQENSSDKLKWQVVTSLKSNPMNYWDEVPRLSCSFLVIVLPLPLLSEKNHLLKQALPHPPVDFGSPDKWFCLCPKAESIIFLRHMAYENDTIRWNVLVSWHISFR